MTARRNKVTEAAAAWRALEPSQRERLISYIRGPWNGNEHQRIVDAALAVLRAAAEPNAKCSCDREAGDSVCFFHPSCACCGEPTTAPVDYCMQCTSAGKDVPR